MIADLRAALLADAVVSAGVGTRIYPQVRPQGSALPALVLTVISGAADYHMRGAGSLRTRRVQVDAWAETYAGMTTLADAVVAALSGYAGTVGDTVFQGVFLDAERDLFDPAKEEGSRAHRRSLDFMIKYRSA